MIIEKTLFESSISSIADFMKQCRQHAMLHHKDWRNNGGYLTHHFFGTDEEIDMQKQIVKYWLTINHFQFEGFFASDVCSTSSIRVTGYFSPDLK